MQDDGEPEHGAVRRAAADGRLGRPRRHAGGDDARLRRGRLPRGRADHLAALADDADVGGARRRRSDALCERRPLYPGFRGYELRRDPRRADVAEVTHPLVRHKLGLLRDVRTPDRDVPPARQRARRCCSPTRRRRTCATEEVEVETPLERRRRSASPARRSPSARSCAPASGMLDGVLSLIPVARVGFIGLYRDEETLAAGRVLREAAGGHRRARGAPARPDARDRQLDRGRGRRSSRKPGAAHHADRADRRAGGDPAHRRRSIPTCAIVVASIDRS